jgi:O-antigen ligase/polysaccharide polymerase Wzy-like membrane protein
MTSVVAAAGVLLLAAVAPFETTTAIVRLPGQTLTNVETVLLLALGAWIAMLVWSRRLPQRSPLGFACLAVIAAMAVASAAAPEESMNAWHMTGRLAAASAVFLLTLDGMTTMRRLEAALMACVLAGVVVALLAVLEFAQFDAVLRVLQRFRASLNVVGAQVRAGGTLQYPTIASMYLEVVFALGVGLMLYAIDRSYRVRAAALLLALIVIGEGIALTFTRAGLLTMATTLAIAGVTRMHQRGLDRGFASVVVLTLVVAALLVNSRTMQSLWLRLTSDGQSAWYRAAIDAPPTLSMTTDERHYVSLAVTNAGRSTWDSTGDPPILLSYHWLRAEDDGVVAFEGERTPFERPVRPGQTARIRALVRAPQHPGRYRLEWDLAQEHRLWFSTEQDAPPSTLSCVTVTGAAVGALPAATPHPRRAVRPGRLVLWKAAARMFAAHPLLGVGPDNFRLFYGRYAGIAGADPRTHSNNMYLEILAGGGLLAAAAFAWLFREAAALFVPAVRSGDPRIVGVACAGVAIALHGGVDSFLSFAPTYILFALTLGFAAAARGMEARADANRV